MEKIYGCLAMAAIILSAGFIGQPDIPAEGERQRMEMADGSPEHRHRDKLSAAAEAKKRELVSLNRAHGSYVRVCLE